MVGGTPPIIGGWKPGAGTKEERRGEGAQLRLRLGWWTVNVNISVSVEDLLRSQEVLGDQVNQVS